MMYRRVLATVNEHLTSEAAARYGLYLAKASDAKLYLVYIARKGAPKKDFDLAQKAIKRLVLFAEKMDTPVEAIIETGDPLEDIKKIVKEKRIEIIFGATRKERKNSGYMLGSFAKGLLNLPCSVALVRIVHFGRLHPGRLLIPLKDTIDNIEERAFFSSLLSKAFHSEVLLLHIKRPLRGLIHGGVYLSSIENEKGLSKDIITFIEYLKKYAVSFEKRLLHGHPGRDITIEAASRRSDLIIMGFSAKGLLRQLIEKSPFEHVLEKTPCNLIIFKPSR